MVCVYPERTLEPPCWLITFPLPRGAGEANAMDMVPILTTVAQAVYSSEKIPHGDDSVATILVPEELKRFLSWWYCRVTFLGGKNANASRALPSLDMFHN